jgi:2-hydroxy-3-keto-5-methylthiopentenyl-1-phosphate phosphatase
MPSLSRDKDKGFLASLSLESMNVLVSDFDGTLTRYDFFDLVRKRWPFSPENDPWEKYVAGRITHFEALAEIFLSIRTSQASLLELVTSMELETGFAESIRVLQNCGWEVVIASAGCDWYIKHLLREAGVSVSLHANPGIFDPERGLEMSLQTGSPFFCATTGIDKAAVVRDALNRSHRVAFAGDGRPDLKPALLVPPERRFARGWLAEALREHGEGFYPFERWSQIADQLGNDEC